MLTKDAKLEELLTNMQSGARGVYDRAVSNAVLFNHKEVSTAHLLLGVMAQGNVVPSLKVPEAMREAGVDYQELSSILKAHTELRASYLDPRPLPSAALRRTLARAVRLAKRRVRGGGRYGIVMSDLLIALLQSRDQVLYQVLLEMGLSRFDLLEAFAPSDGRAIVPLQLVE